MASTQASSSSASSSGSSSLEGSRPQAGPLPSKRGEIGFREDLLEGADSERGSSPSPLPERHPADRDAPPSADSAPAVSPPSTVSAPTSSSSPSATLSDDSSSTSSLKKRKGFLSFLKPKKSIHYQGLALTTLLAFLAQVLVMLGTVAAWAVAGIFLSKKKNNNDGGMSAASSAIFVHVVFAVAFLCQCLFLERRIYVLRAQKYAFLHPGEILPSARRRGQHMDSSIGLSPWGRPPLPTYAAALAQSGVGTGDVEDHLIAAPPPPAYGNTRGSTLLLSGFLTDGLRAQRPITVRTEASQQPDRPLSYRSVDDDWEVIQDADRARRLEETLAIIERPRPRPTRSTRS